MLLPSGDHAAFETRAPAGSWIALLRAVGGGDDLDADVVAHRQRPGAVRLEVDEQAAELVERLREGLHQDGTVADLVEEPFLVGAGVGQGDVQVARREDRVRQLPRRRLVAVRLEDVVRRPARRSARPATTAIWRSRPESPVATRVRSSVASFPSLPALRFGDYIRGILRAGGRHMARSVVGITTMAALVTGKGGSRTALHGQQRLRPSAAGRRWCRSTSASSTSAAIPSRT